MCAEGKYFTVAPTACTIRTLGALAIYCGDVARKNPDGSTSISLRAPLLLMPPEMFRNPQETMATVARVLNENAHLFFESAKPAEAAPAADAGDGWGWWSGYDGEHYGNGPFATRDEAVRALCGRGGYIVEARQDPLLPGGQPMAVDRIGIARRIAQRLGCTAERVLDVVGAAHG
ncbi:hypothetical protein D1114_07240 [Cereibacter sphaeroides]|uniref:Uncharacterized protein n=1 Tax=Cereibacter sphaeroides TaxID=1063 RepID=A0AAX1UN21_CERSP|nr:hypothetical protein [Cereibacter sphaeroides]RHZ96495.1 hypothetical protein D1114_07240 [Cereibacter sphaeroides]